MVNLFSSLNSSLSAMQAYEQALAVTQNNVNNASTAGYAKQSVSLQSLSSRPEAGLAGGVVVGAIGDSRDPLAEAAVRQQLSSSGSLSEKSGALSAIESILDWNDPASISNALTQLFDSFSALSVAPNDTAAREEVIASATNVAESFQRVADDLVGVAAQINTGIEQTVAKINELGGRIHQYNEQVLSHGSADAGTSARLFADLESLAELVDVQVLAQQNGTVNILVGGQYGLVVGDQFQAIGVQSVPPTGDPGALPTTAIVGANGTHITGVITQGQLGGALTVRNEVLPSLLGDGGQPGSLNTLAKEFADRVNELLTGGLVEADVPGEPLFTYSGSSDAQVAGTLTLNPAMTAAMIATIDSGPPYAANGIALTIAGLADSSLPENQIGGLGYLDYYSSISSTIGELVQSARNGESYAVGLLNQARETRDQASLVSLDQEAASLIELQSGYQAAAQVISIVDELIQTAIGIGKR